MTQYTQVIEQRMKFRDQYGSERDTEMHQIAFTESYKAREVAEFLDDIADGTVLRWNLVEMARMFSDLQQLSFVQDMIVLPVVGGDGRINMIPFPELLSGKVDVGLLRDLKPQPEEKGAGMKVDKKIVIDEGDASDLHGELTEVLDFLSQGAPSGEGWVKDEFPNLTKLKRLLTQVVASERGEEVYEKLSQQEKLAAKTRLGRLRVVSADGQA